MLRGLTVPGLKWTEPVVSPFLTATSPATQAASDTQPPWIAAAGMFDVGIETAKTSSHSAPTITSIVSDDAPVLIPMPPPALSRPAKEETFGSGQIYFTWMSGSSAYRIQVSKSDDFARNTIDESVQALSYKTGTSLESGTYFWRVKCTDAVKGASDWSPVWSFTVDTTPPTNTTNGNFINSGETWTNSTKVILSIAGTKNSGIQGYYISQYTAAPEAVDPGWTAVAPTASYSAQVPYSLNAGDGTKTVYVWFKDTLGHVSLPVTDTIILDTLPPEAAISNHPASPTNLTSADFSFTATEPASTFQCSLDGRVYTACAESQSYEALSEGSHTIAVKATDKAGNSQPAPATFTWIIDTAPPDTAITGRPYILSNSASADFIFSSSEPQSTFECAFDGNAYVPCISPQSYTALSEGPHAFAVKAKDASGNPDPTPALYSWTIDMTPFDTMITSTPDDPSNTGAASFGFISTKAGAAYRCKLDDDGYSACVEPMKYAELAEGDHVFSVKAIDAYGNEDATPAIYEWRVTLPPIPKTPPSFVNKGRGYLTDKNTVNLTIAAASKKGVAGYFISENPATPDASDPRWVTFAPVKEFSNDVPFKTSKGKGTKKLHVWFKDAEGNVSDVKSDEIFLFNSNHLLLLLILVQAAFLVL